MTWVRTIAADQVATDGLAGADAAGEPVALYCVDGVFYATENLCTHGQALLSDGWLDGHLIECPLHQGLFDIRTGAAAGPPCTEAVRSFPVKVEDGFIFVDIDDD